MCFPVCISYGIVIWKVLNCWSDIQGQLRSLAMVTAIFLIIANWSVYSEVFIEPPVRWLIAWNISLNCFFLYECHQYILVLDCHFGLVCHSHQCFQSSVMICVDHCQVMLYNLMCSERRRDVEAGILVYLKELAMQLVPTEYASSRGQCWLHSYSLSGHYPLV